MLILSKSGEISESALKEIIENGTLDLTENYYITDTDGKFEITEDLTINGNKHSIYGRIILDAKNDGNEEPLNVTLNDVVIDGNRFLNNPVSTDFIGVHSQNQGKDTEPPVRELNLVMENCTVQNFYGKAVYITNATYLEIDHCTFRNVATTDENSIQGDHAIDLCIGGVNNAVIRITNNIFEETIGHNASIQVQKRDPNHGNDDNADDWGDFPQGTSIESVYIANNDFTGVDRTVNGDSSKAPTDIRLGSWPKDAANDDVRTNTKAFPVKIVANGTTLVSSCTKEGGNGNNSPDHDVKVALTSGSQFSSNGAYDENKGAADIEYSLDSGSATLSGYVPEYMEITVQKGASAVMDDLENHGSVYGYDNNITGTSTGNAIDNTDTVITPPTWDDDDDYIPPIVPSQTEDSGDDDSVTIVACAAAAVVAALLAAFLIIDRKH